MVDTVELWFSRAVPAPLPLAHLNGALIAVAEARVSALDRGFLFADGVYEAIAVDGRPFRLPSTCRGSRAACARCASPIDPSDLARALIEALIAETQRRRTMSVYLQVTRAEARPDHAFPVEPTVFACFAWSGPPRRW
jgi:D-alanine transaminase